MSMDNAVLKVGNKLLTNKGVQEALGAVGTAALVAAKGVVVTAAPVVLPFAAGAVAIYGLMEGVNWAVNKVTENK